MYDGCQLGPAQLAQLELLVAVVLLEAVKCQLVELHLRLHDVMLRSLDVCLDRVSTLR